MSAPLDIGATIPFATLSAIRAALLAPEPNAPQIARAHGVTLRVVRWAAQGTGVRIASDVALRFHVIRAAAADRAAQMAAAYEHGESMRAIATRYGVSRQRVWKILSAHRRATQAVAA